MVLQQLLLWECDDLAPTKLPIEGAVKHNSTAACDCAVVLYTRRLLCNLLVNLVTRRLLCNLLVTRRLLCNLLVSLLLLMLFAGVMLPRPPAMGYAEYFQTL
jgi:hypothetical protein